MIEINIKGIALQFQTAPEVFSPNRIDRGTLAMLSEVDFHPEDFVCDLGCGYGVVGILAAKITSPERVVLVDNDPLAVALAGENIILNRVVGVTVIQSRGFQNVIQKGFSVILVNPPYHTDFSVPKEFIEKGFNRLAVGGRFYMVTKRKTWYERKLRSIFGGVKVREIDGYFVFRADKRKNEYAKVKKTFAKKGG